MPEWFTPPQLAASRRLRLGKVLSWIHSGQLAAVNCAENVGGRPRWRISQQALDAFDAARSNRNQVAAPMARRQRKASTAEITEYF